MPFSGACGIWALRKGDFTPTPFPGDASGLSAALSYAASNGPDGAVIIYPGGGLISIPAIPAGVRLTTHLDGRHKEYAPGGLVDPVVNVLDYGAKGDGVTDDAAAIMAAHGALPSATGGTILFPTGNFLIKSTLLFTKTTELRGTGSGVIAGSPTASTIITKHSSMSSYAIDFQKFRSGARDLVVEAQVSLEPPSDGIRLFENSCFLDNVFVGGMSRHGIVIGVVGGAIRNCNFWSLNRVMSRENAGDGLHIDATDGAGPNANAGVATLFQAIQNGGKGIRLVNGSKNVFLGACTEGNAEEGIYITGNSDNNLVVGGDQEGNAGGGSGTVQIRVANTGADDNMFVCPGVSSPEIIVLEPGGGASRSMLYDFSHFSLPRNGSEAFSNGPPGSNDISGDYIGTFCDNSAERVRIGIIQSTLSTGLTPSQILNRNSDGTLLLCSRGDTDTGKVEMKAGAGLVRYARLSTSTLETNAQIDLVGGAELRVAGNAVVRGREPAIANADGTLADITTKFNTLLASLRATGGHGLIAD